MNNIDMVSFQSKEYICKWINIDDDYLLIAEEDLESVLITDKHGYASNEARLLDEMIYFYVSSNILKKKDDDLKNFLDKAVR